MKRSKLELHLDILNVLNQAEMMNTTQIMYKVNICHRFLEEYLALLIRQNLVEKKVFDKNRTKYSITPIGEDLLRTFTELKRILQIGEDISRQVPDPLVFKS